MTDDKYHATPVESPYRAVQCFWGVSALSPLLIRPSYASALKSGFAGERIGLSPEDRDYLLDADHVPQYGKSQANVVIAEFSDFRCPHCRTSYGLLCAVLSARW